MSLFGFTREDGCKFITFAKMALADKFIGTALGGIWVVVSPLLLMAVMTFVFGFVFPSRMPGVDSGLGQVLWLLAGYSPWLGINEGLSASTASIVRNAGLVKNLHLKTELLPLSSALTAMFPAAIGLLFVFALLLGDGQMPKLVWLWVVPAVVFTFVATAGLGMILATGNVFLRDVSQALPNVLMIVMFASPLFYSVGQFPEWVKTVMMVNPLYAVSEAFRQPLVFGSAPPPWAITYLAVLAVVLFWAGLKVVRRMQRHFEALL